MGLSMAARSGEFLLGGDMPVHRLGFGTVQLSGPGGWGDPKDPDEAVRVLRRAVDLGVTFFDTADAYGPFVVEQLIRKALHPYPPDLVVGTKVGFTRQGPELAVACGRPEYLRQQVELSLRHLAVERLDLLQLHRVDPLVPFEDQVGELKNLQVEGKIRHLGLSEVSVTQIEQARLIADIVSVQNLYNLANRSAEDVLEYCSKVGLAFIPWFPLATGALCAPNGPLTSVSNRTGHTPSQIAIAWLLRRSSAMLPIPGTSSCAHLEENLAAAQIELTDEDFVELRAAV
ncbi:aldo/keto reductase [Nocardioides sp. LS1]|uniref:aldo/keto reductase n=1 Tax=Nocardioides sp. LS1 TaxID=1027620 RepID=UPI000F624234|nr:aldo/keto reductase [Nocardioides sp. LS1]GCD91149.1 oxidoreductase [Nocardioides sp. LS1]